MKKALHLLHAKNIESPQSTNYRRKKSKQH